MTLPITIPISIIKLTELLFNRNIFHIVSLTFAHNNIVGKLIELLAITQTDRSVATKQGHELEDIVCDLNPLCKKISGSKGDLVYEKDGKKIFVQLKSNSNCFNNDSLETAVKNLAQYDESVIISIFGESGKTSVVDKYSNKSIPFYKGEAAYDFLNITKEQILDGLNSKRKDSNDNNNSNDTYFYLCVLIEKLFADVGLAQNSSFDLQDFNKNYLPKIQSKIKLIYKEAKKSKNQGKNEYTIS